MGVAEVKRSGRDVTIVAASIMVHHALVAADRLARQGVEAEVLDLRTLSPLDEDAILTSVARTGRLVVADESPLHGGASSGIAGMVADRGFRFLKAPVRRVGRPDAPIPASAEMEAFLTPGADDIVRAVTEIL